MNPQRVEFKNGSEGKRQLRIKKLRYQITENPSCPRDAWDKVGESLVLLCCLSVDRLRRTGVFDHRSNGQLTES